jgi:hypothetical protein
MMKCLPFVVVFAVLVPALVYAQNQKSSDCQTLEAAGNFIGSDEALVNGLVCKVRKPKTNSLPSTQVAGKAAEGSVALLGNVAAETLRSTEKAGASSVGTTPTPAATPGHAAADSTAGGAAQSSFFEKIPEKTLGEIARAYRKKAGARTTNQPEEGDLERKKPTDEVERVATPSHKTPTPATIADIQTTGSAQVPAPAESPAAARKSEIIAAAPAAVQAVPEEALRTAKDEVVVAVPQAQANAVKQEASPASAGPVHDPAVKLETNLPAMIVTAASSLEVQAPAQTGMVASAQRTPAREPTAASPVPSAWEQAPEPAPERSLRVGVFAVPQPPATNLSPQPLANTTEEDSAFKEGQLSTCIKNVSLGSLDKDRLFLAIPEWALKWHEKNQKRFPGICFSNSLMPEAQNFLVVFYTAEPPAAGTESSAKISGLGEVTPVIGKGGFTTSAHSTWHYAYEQDVMTTITSVSADTAPHNQPSTILYATAYSEQGIPISQHWPASASAPDKETSTKPRKSHDVSPPAFRRMEELLNQMVADIAKL